MTSNTLPTEVPSGVSSAAFGSLRAILGKAGRQGGGLPHRGMRGGGEAVRSHDGAGDDDCEGVGEVLGALKASVRVILSSQEIRKCDAGNVSGRDAVS